MPYPPDFQPHLYGSPHAPTYTLSPEAARLRANATDYEDTLGAMVRAIDRIRGGDDDRITPAAALAMAEAMAALETARGKFRIVEEHL